MDNLTSVQKAQLASAIRSAFSELEYDVTLRNKEMNKRDRYIYGEGLWETLDIAPGFDKTLYNYLRRVVEIHKSQFAGRPHQVYSQYNKEDLSLIEENEQLDEQTKKTEMAIAELKNKKKKANADLRKNLLDAIRRDNGGSALYEHGAEIGSAYGETIFKQWADWKEKKIKRVVIETPQNYRAGWSDSNFKERDWDGYVSQITPVQAGRLYGKYLDDGEVFETTIQGSPFASTQGGGNTADPLDQKNGATSLIPQTDRKMVSMIDFVGYLPGWGVKDGKLQEVKPGEETRFGATIVGGCVCQIIADSTRLPKYYRIPNKDIPQRAWGESDISESAMQINATIIERMSDWITVANKTLFPLIKAKGFDNATVPKKQQRQMKVVPMDVDQDLEAVNMPNNFGFDYKQIIDQLETAFVRVTGIGRLLFDDPQQANSNQALITTLKGVIDIVEGKQKRWEPILLEMDNDALDLVAKMHPDLKDVIYDDPGNFLYLSWPSVMRKEDAAYQQMWLNLFNAGTISWDTFLLKTTDVDTSEEMDRLRDNMKDPIAAAVIAHGLPEIAHQTLNKALGIPPWGYVVPKLNIRGELSPQQEGNIAENYGWGQGPFGNSMGPQGSQGDAADQNFVNQGQINGNPFDGGMPTSVTPGQPLLPGHPSPDGAMAQPTGGQTPAQPTLTTDQNTGQTASQPGSGAPAISPQGAIKKHHQNHGR